MVPERPFAAHSTITGLYFGVYGNPGDTAAMHGQGEVQISAPAPQVLLLCSVGHREAGGAVFGPFRLLSLRGRAGKAFVTNTHHQNSQKSAKNEKNGRMDLSKYVCRMVPERPFAAHSTITGLFLGVYGNPGDSAAMHGQGVVQISAPAPQVLLLCSVGHRERRGCCFRAFQAAFTARQC